MNQFSLVISESNQGYDCRDYTSSKMDSASSRFLIFPGLNSGSGDWNILNWFDNINTIPTEYAVSANYPNPFNAQTNIRFDIPDASNVNLSIYNVLGRKADVLIDGYQNAGSYSVTWDASKFSNCVYFSKVTAGKYLTTKQMHLLK
ncbi:MAG: T9SS type A sorting domain-containing protein [candidate division Zixibacteria bacterium]|nr:T9SS type A sorting domain-containing protein [candidate division Zixibacteria bacterium]